MSYLVFEIGTEEMPAGAISSALDQLQSKVESALQAARIPANKVLTFGTPRRLIIAAEGIPERQPDLEVILKGPAKSVGFDANGSPTGAAIGFARKNGIDLSQLEVVSTPQGEYLQATILEKGKPAIDVLGSVLTDSAKSLTFPKVMRWGDTGTRFVRPVRWIFCLLDSDVVPMEFGNVQSDRKTRGHRFLSPSEIEVKCAEDLFKVLTEKFVIYDPEERKNAIRNQANELATSISGTAVIDPELLDENTWLVEYPTALLGKFDQDFLELPRSVLETSMKKHQRFFPVQGANGDLTNYFIAVRNGNDHGLEIVTDGNERVLSARFSDAAFFYNQDKETTLDEMTPGLERLIFQEKLGTIDDKKNRLVWIAHRYESIWDLSKEDSENLIRASKICKSDLVSRMVIELPALQGVMGKQYALNNGEKSEVAQAILEQYLPKSAGGSIPTSFCGQLLAVADRLDTLAGYVGLNILPSGSSDPYGLRRAAHGVLQILVSMNSTPSLRELVSMASAAYSDRQLIDFDEESVLTNMETIFTQRMNAILSDSGFSLDMIEATLSATSVLDVPVNEIIRRVEALSLSREHASYTLLVQTGTRICNILKRRPNADVQVEPGLFQQSEESELLDQHQLFLKTTENMFQDQKYTEIITELTVLSVTVEKFFASVMVMAEDNDIRSNRLSLLDRVGASYWRIADFTKVLV